MERTGKEGGLEREAVGHVLLLLFLLLFLLFLLLFLLLFRGYLFLLKVLAHLGLGTLHLLHKAVHIDLDRLTGAAKGWSLVELVLFFHVDVERQGAVELFLEMFYLGNVALLQAIVGICPVL